MKNCIIIGCIVLVVLFLVGRCNKYCSERVFESCMKSELHSEETCYKYAYQQ